MKPARRLLFVFITFAFASLPIPSYAGCTRRIATNGPSSRVVVLAGGDAWMLFHQYLSEIRQKDLDVSLWRSTVMISTAGHQEVIELGWAKMLTGESSDRLWERALAGRKAELNASLIAQADAGSWDLICVGQPVIAAGRPPSAPTTSTTASPTAPANHRPIEALTYFKSGLQFAAHGDYENAIKEFSVVERIDPQFTDLQMNMAMAHMQRKNYVKASEYMTRAAQQDGGNPNVHYNMACLQARLGQNDDAIASLITAKSRGFVMTTKVRNDPDFASLRGRKDFETLFASR